jgi:ketosteroid isomerase-like protein
MRSNSRTWSLVPLVALLFAGVAPAAAGPDEGELTRLLREFLAGASRNDAAIHERFWADELVYTGSAGRRRGKVEVLADVRAAAARPAGPATTYTAEDIRIQQYGDTAIVAFRLVGTTGSGEKSEAAQYLNTGTFLKRNGEWRVVAWQSTRAAR